MTKLSRKTNGELDVMPASINSGPLNAMARGARIKFVVNKGQFAPTGCVHVWDPSFVEYANQVLEASSQ